MDKKTQFENLDIMLDEQTKDVLEAYAKEYNCSLEEMGERFLDLGSSIYNLCQDKNIEHPTMQDILEMAKNIKLVKPDQEFNHW